MYIALPNELLHKVFSFLSEDSHRKNPAVFKDIRLVCHQFNRVGSAFLIREITVRLSSHSLARLENICFHPAFANSITTVEINADYFDTELAGDRRKFAERCASELSEMLEDAELCLKYPEQGETTIETRVEKLSLAPSEFEEIDGPNFDQARLTTYQQILIHYHEEYARRCSDQEDVRRDNTHISKIVRAFGNLPRLDRIAVTDKVCRTSKRIWNYIIGGGVSVHDPEFFISYLDTSRWNGTSLTTHNMEPPLEMLGKLLSSLGRAGVRPCQLSIEMCVPFSLLGLTVSKEEAAGIEDLVSRSKTIKVAFDSWKRQRPVTGRNNTRPREEMIALGSLTQSLTSAPSLKELEIIFWEYPTLYEFPSISLSTILPLSSFIWKNLAHLVLSHQPLDLTDAVILVQNCKDTLKSIVAESLFLRTGDWDVLIDVLRELEVIESVCFSFPKGRMFGVDELVRFKHSELMGLMEKYVLKQVDTNPLRGKRLEIIDETGP